MAGALGRSAGKFQENGKSCGPTLGVGLPQAVSALHSSQFLLLNSSGVWLPAVTLRQVPEAEFS